MHAQTGVLRELTLRAAEACFGHRLMMDVIVPGGVARDIAPAGAAQLRSLLAEVRRVFPRLIELYDNTASLQDRTVSTGFVKPEYARQFGAGGYVGRASDRAFDARRTPGYAPYNELAFEVPVLTAGDVNAADLDPHSRGSSRAWRWSIRFLLHCRPATSKRRSTPEAARTISAKAWALWKPSAATC